MFGLNGTTNKKVVPTRSERFNYTKKKEKSTTDDIKESVIVKRGGSRVVRGTPSESH